MFVREHQNQFRGAQADVQQYYGVVGVSSKFSWNKPVGTSFVYIMLVGAGGAGDGATTGGGTGAVGTWFGPAKSIPSSLQVNIGSLTTSIIANVSKNTETVMMSVNAASTTSGGTQTTQNGYWNSGFSRTTAGANGATTASVGSVLTFLSPGGVGSTMSGNYGDTAGIGGLFSLSPILTSVSSSGDTPTSASVARTYGCGSPSTWTSPTAGMAIIASW